MRTSKYPTLALALALASSGCAADPSRATDAELAPQDQDTTGRPLAPGERRAPAPPEAGGGAATAPATAGGPIATLILVTQLRNPQGRERPGAVIFSSDPECDYMKDERPRPSRVLKPLDAPKMGDLLRDLDQAGLRTLTPRDEPIESSIDGDRQIVVLRNGRRVAFHRSDFQQDGQLFKTYSRCEKVVIDYSHGGDAFVETRGLSAIPGVPTGPKTGGAPAAPPR